ncbi:hypothetical protein BGZ74_003706 [Mortierella antarctica]|nr:hypothetical protein BGZ74_003706 [Mortierella antarctica]
MGSITTVDPPGRPTRKAATKTALAIRNEAMDEITESNVKKERSNTAEGDKEAFSIIMASAKAKSAKPKRRAHSPEARAHAYANLDHVHSLVPDLEDLVVEASRARADGYHHESYHHFTSKDTCRTLQSDLLTWYDIHYRRLPWRKSFHIGDHSLETELANPGQRAYEVWVSEIMCQQTQVATVIPYYNRWMSTWPTIAALADADLEEVNKVWTGLGYYSRASRLHQGAQKVMKEFNGVLPSDPAVLEKEIPGVGRYTAGAIASHAYNVPAELVDGNVIRVLSRLRAIGGDVKSPKVIDLHWQVAKELIHKERPGCFNQALMELGATVCTPQNPKCGECPVQSNCRAYAEVVDKQRNNMQILGSSKKRKTENDDERENGLDSICTLCLPGSDVDPKDQGLVTQYPRKAVKKAPRDEECAVAILERIRKIGDSPISEYLLIKRPEKGLLAGMWEFPTVEQDQLDRDKHGKASKDYTPSTYKERSNSSIKLMSDSLGLDWVQGASVSRTDLGSVQHLFSHIKKVYHVEWVMAKDISVTTENRPKKASPEVAWLSEQELATAAIPTGINKTYQLLQKFKAQGQDSKAKKEDPKRKRVAKKEGGDISKFFMPK